MSKCDSCKYAVWDYDFFYTGGKNHIDWFLRHCRMGQPPALLGRGCEAYEEYTDDEPMDGIVPREFREDEDE